MYWYILALCVFCIANVVAFLKLKQKNKREMEKLLQKIKEENEESEHVLRETISNITHDLKTPLTAIHGYAQGILDGVATTPDRMNRYVTTIRNKSDDMAALVDELSFFAHIYKQDIEYKFVPVDAHHYISSCLGNLSLDLQTKKIDFCYQSNIPPDTMIRIDTDKMKRVFNNIIGNAAKYIMNEKGLICVSVEEEKNNICVHIRDNGIGIAEKEIPYIFDRFYRTDRSRNSSTGGSGLGLAITKKIVVDHGGRITAESEVGKGTMISFTIPRINMMEE